MPTTDLADATFVQVSLLSGLKQDRAAKETHFLGLGSTMYRAAPALLLPGISELQTQSLSTK